MLTTRTRWRPALSGAVALIAALALGGCGGSDDPAPQSRSTASAGPSETTSAEPSESASEQPSQEPTESASASASASTTASASTPRDVLFAAADLPQLNDSSPWTAGRTGAAGQQPFGLCAKFDLLTIGAKSAVERTYTTAGGDTAGEQVAEFPDAINAVRAGKVLEAWHRDCAKRVERDNLRVRPITSVPVTAGKGWTYLVSYERGGEGHFHSYGVALSGSRMAVIRMDHAGQDHDYEAGQDPVELAVKAAATRLG